MTSEVSRRAREFVAEHLPEARGLGTALAERIEDPEAFVAVLREGLERIGDEPYAAEQERVAPGSGLVLGVRQPLIDAVAAQLRQPLSESSAGSALWLAQRLFSGPEREVRLFSHVPLDRSLPEDPERSWQLMRRLARAAGDWISVDSLADLYALGILYEQVRWAEIEQLAYSDSRWERRLVGSTIARLPYHLPAHRRRELARLPALMLVKSLIGDSEPDVQKSLSWALRSWHAADPRGVESVLRDEAKVAAANDDGQRAWVVRDALTLPGLDSALVAQLRSRLAGIQRRAGAPSTSTAGAVSAAFMSAAHGADLADRAVREQGARQEEAGRAR